MVPLSSSIIERISGFEVFVVVNSRCFFFERERERLRVEEKSFFVYLLARGGFRCKVDVGEMREPGWCKSAQVDVMV